MFSYTSEVESGVRSSSSSSAATAANKKASNMAQVKDGPGVIKVEGETNILSTDCKWLLVVIIIIIFIFLLLFSFLLIYIFY